MIKELRNNNGSIRTKKPSEEMVWLKHYEPGAYEKANNIPKHATLWDVLEQKLYEYSEITALEYFKNGISRTDFIKSVYVWARAFKSLGVEENEVVPIYSPFFPDICGMVCALNMIGAVTYFLKLEISPEALEEETANSKIAVVYDGMWKNVREVFFLDRFKKILVATSADGMANNTLICKMKRKMVSFISYFQALKNRSVIPHTGKFIWLAEAKTISDYYTGKIKATFVEDREAFITSSSGTSIGGIVKGTIATNESAIAQLLQGTYVEYPVGGKCLTNLPPTAATSLNGLFFSALYHGMTCIIEPRLSEQNFYDQIMNYKPQVAILTGAFWETFFRTIEREIKKGKKPNLSFFTVPIIGGEGSTPEDKAWFDNLMNECGSPVPMISGCGMSEVFSVISVEKPEMITTVPPQKRPVISVGIPYPGIEIKIVDKAGDELDYNELGELWIRGKSLMKGYYGKPELTDKAIAKDGWLHTGDIYEIDEDGVLYIYGRKDDKILLSDGTDFQLWKIAYQIRTDEDIKYCFVNAYPLKDGTYSLVAHVVFENSLNCNKEDIYRRLDSMLSNFLPDNLWISGYMDHKTTFSASPTTAKKDRNDLMKTFLGYLKPSVNGMRSLSIIKNDHEDYYSLKYF